jgi:hypothetical protein
VRIFDRFAVTKYTKYARGDFGVRDVAVNETVGTRARSCFSSGQQSQTRMLVAPTSELELTVFLARRAVKPFTRMLTKNWRSFHCNVGPHSVNKDARQRTEKEDQEPVEGDTS